MSDALRDLLAKGERPLVDPMGLLLQASRIDPVLHKAALQVEAMLVGVRELHHNEGRAWGVIDLCTECQDEYPCPTIRILDGDQ